MTRGDETDNLSLGVKYRYKLNIINYVLSSILPYLKYKNI